MDSSFSSLTSTSNIVNLIKSSLIEKQKEEILNTKRMNLDKFLTTSSTAFSNNTKMNKNNSKSKSKTKSIVHNISSSTISSYIDVDKSSCQNKKFIKVSNNYNIKKNKVNLNNNPFYDNLNNSSNQNQNKTYLNKDTSSDFDKNDGFFKKYYSMKKEMKSNNEKTRSISQYSNDINKKYNIKRYKLKESEIETKFNEFINDIMENEKKKFETKSSKISMKSKNNKIHTEKENYYDISILNDRLQKEIDKKTNQIIKIDKISEEMKNCYFQPELHQNKIDFIQYLRRQLKQQANKIITEMKKKGYFNYFAIPEYMFDEEYLFTRFLKVYDNTYFTDYYRMNRDKIIQN